MKSGVSSIYDQPLIIRGFSIISSNCEIFSVGESTLETIGCPGGNFKFL